MFSINPPLNKKELSNKICQVIAMGWRAGEETEHNMPHRKSGGIISEHLSKLFCRTKKMV